MDGNKMVKALIKLDENEDQVLNLVKAKYRLRNKNDALRLVIKNYEENQLEPELRPEYIKKLKRIEKEGYGRIFKSIDELKKHIES